MAGTDGSLRVGGTNDYLETVTVTTSAGTGLHREGVAISDPINAAGRARVTEITAKGPALAVRFADGVQLDAFGRLRTSSAKTLFDSQQEYGLDTRTTWDASANGTAHTASSNGSATDGAGNSVGPRNLNTRMVPITVSSTNGHYAILQSRQYPRYIPGKSQLVLITGVFAADADYSARFVLRTNTSGTPSDARAVNQADWNIDPMDGTGPSGITLDLTKTQILFIQAQWLGVGRVIMGFDIDGVLYPCHEFLNANNLSVPYTQSFNLPVRLEGQNVAGQTANRIGYFDRANGAILETTSNVSGGTINFICCSVQTESGDEARGFPRSVDNGITEVSVGGTLLPILAIRPKATYNGAVNRAHIELIDFGISARTNAVNYRVILGATLPGATWVSVGSNSIVEYSVTSSAITGGSQIISGYAPAGTGSSRDVSQGDADIRNPLTISQIDSLTVNQPILVLAAVSMSATANVVGAMNWHEQVI